MLCRISLLFCRRPMFWCVGLGLGLGMGLLVEAHAMSHFCTILSQAYALVSHSCVLWQNAVLLSRLRRLPCRISLLFGRNSVLWCRTPAPYRHSFVRHSMAWRQMPLPCCISLICRARAPVSGARAADQGKYSKEGASASSCCLFLVHNARSSNQPWNF